jgi:hypothetical protein
LLREATACTNDSSGSAAPSSALVEVSSRTEADACLHASDAAEQEPFHHVRLFHTAQRNHSPFLMIAACCLSLKAFNRSVCMRFTPYPKRSYYLESPDAASFLNSSLICVDFTRPQTASRSRRFHHLQQPNPSQRNPRPPQHSLLLNLASSLQRRN